MSPLGNALVWCALAIIVLSNLMAASPEIHAAFCPHERAQQEAAAHHELPPPWADDDQCPAVLFQNGFSADLAACPIVAVSLVLLAVIVRRPEMPAPARAAALHPPSCGPPISV